MPPKSQTLVQLPRSICVSLREAGVDLDAIARRVGVASAAEHMTLAQSDALLDQALLAVKDPSFVLTATARLRPELFGVGDVLFGLMGGDIRLASAGYGQLLFWR